MAGWQQSPPVEEIGQDRTAFESALVRSAQHDRVHFSRLFDHFWEPLHRFCYYRVGSWSDAEDIAQTVMIRVAREIHGFSEERGSGSFRGWLFTIAHNACIDALRSRSRRPAQPLPLDGAGMPHVVPPDEAAELDATHGWIRTLLGGLPPDQAEVMHLRMAELTTGEIATVLGKSPASVAKLTERARPRLRMLMDTATGARHD